MQQLQIPVIPTSDVFILFGNRREGKSVLAKALLRAKPHVIVVDTKQNEDWSDVGAIVRGDQVYKVGGGRWIYQPPTPWPMEERETFFGRMLQIGNRVLYLDEIIDNAESATKYPHNLRRCYKLGGSAHLGMGGTTQEPRGIPSWTAGQADYIFTFHVGLPEYRDRIDQFFEERVPWEQLRSRSRRFVWKDRHGMHGPTWLDLKHPNAPKPTTRPAGRETPAA